ncbi:MAG: glycosyl hydrolase [Trichodesmium sp.]
MRHKQRLIFSFLTSFIVIIGTWQGIASFQNVKLEPPKTLIPAELFGMHIHRAATTTLWPLSPFKSWRLWDAGVAWGDMEPKQGKWNFETLDKYVNLAQKHQVNILLTLGQTPTWASARPTDPSPYGAGWPAEPKNIADWRNYVRTIASRYKGKISYYEIWNEPNFNQKYYSGSVEKMVELSREAYQILKEIDPSVMVVSPSATGVDSGLSWLDEYLTKGGGSYVDIIGHHFYVSGKPEELLPLIANLQKVIATHGLTQKPIWHTESGWFGLTKDSLPANVQGAAYVARAYILNWATGISRFYWYAWDNQFVKVPMIQDNLQSLTLSGKAYGEVQKWLVGTQMNWCKSDIQKNWICQLTREGGYKAWIIWNPEHNFNFQIPQEWDIKRIRDLTDSRSKLPIERIVKINPSPLLLENMAT